MICSRICKTTFRFVFALAVWLGAAEDGLAGRREMIVGPVDAQVVRVIDGDTFLAEVHIWPGQRITVGVRIRGIDAPEMKSRCPAEKAAARHSRAALERLLKSGRVQLSRIQGGKYYGRVLADVGTAEGISVAARLLSMELVRAYGGGRRIRISC